MDRLDHALFDALHIDGRAPFSRIAEVLDVSDQTVARRYRRRRSVGELRVVGLPVAERVGLDEWFVRVRCTPDAAGPLAEALARRVDTSWVSIAAGGTEIVGNVLPRSSTERDALLLGRLPRTPRVLDVTAHCKLHQFAGGATDLERRSTVLTADQVVALRTGVPDPEPAGGPIELDDVDQRMLDMLVTDGRTSYAELADATARTAGQVRRRLRRLRATGAVFFDLEQDRNLLGMDTYTILWLSVVPGSVTAVGEALAGHQEIVFASAVTGPMNVVAGVVTPGTTELYTFLTDRIGALPGVARLETTPTLRRVKRAGTVIPGPAPRPGDPRSRRP